MPEHFKCFVAPSSEVPLPKRQILPLSKHPKSPGFAGGAATACCSLGSGDALGCEAMTVDEMSCKTNDLKGEVWSLSHPSSRLYLRK